MTQGRKFQRTKYLGSQSGKVIAEGEETQFFEGILWVNVNNQREDRGHF